VILALYALFCLVTIPILFQKDRLIGIVYALLFVYSVFSLIGYMYIPELSVSISAYFGEKVGYTALYFIFSSMFLIFISNMIIYGQYSAKTVGRGFQTNFTKEGVFTHFSLSIPTFIALIFAFFLYMNLDKLSWAEAQQENIDLSLSVFIAMFKIMVGIIVVIYVIIREKCFQNYSKLIPSFICLVVLFLISSAFLGNRTDPAALIVGILYFEFSRQNLSLRVLSRSFVLILISIALLSVVESVRYDNAVSAAGITEKIIRNDYFAPAHMLFASIAYGFVDFGEVLRSNFSNAMILQYYPYLQETVTDMFNEGVATRSAGYAFFLLSEGFIAFGFLGIFYNAVVVSFFVRLWNSFGCTDSRFVNLLIKTVLATMCINVVRTQSSQFIKITYTYFLPVMFIAFLILGLKVGLARRTVRFES
jgi:hypothetical protein